MSDEKDFVTACIWCGEMMDDARMSEADAQALYHAHDLNCEKNPLRATIATLTAERDDFERKGKELCQSYGASLMQVAVLREALTLVSETYTPEAWQELAASARHALAVGKVREALAATPADFDCIVEVVKAAVGVQLAPDDNAEIWIAAEKALRKAVKALTPKAREMLK